MAQPPARRYGVLDAYRFLAALGVVLYHFENNLSPLRGPATDVLERFQSLVDFFFVLSGFVLMHSYAGGVTGIAAYRGFLRKRLARIYPLHLATLLLCAAIAGIVAVRHVPVRDGSLFALDQLPQNLLLIHAWGTVAAPGLNFPSWSISAEWFVYLLFPVFAAVVRRVGPVASLGLAAGCALATEAGRAGCGLRPGDLATFDFGMLRAVPSFLAGMAVCRIVEGRPATSLSWRIPHALAVLLLVLMLAKAPPFAIIALYPLLVGLIAIAERGGRPTRLASPLAVSLGNASFAIYMLHAFVEVACQRLLLKLGWTGAPALLVGAGLGTAVIVALGCVSYRVFESPLRRVLAGNRATPRRGEGVLDGGAATGYSHVHACLDQGSR